MGFPAGTHSSHESAEGLLTLQKVGAKDGRAQDLASEHFTGTGHLPLEAQLSSRSRLARGQPCAGVKGQRLGGPSGISEGPDPAGSRRSKAARRTLRSQARPSHRKRPQQPQPSPCPVTRVSAADSGPAPRAASASRPSRADPQRSARFEDPAGPAPLTESPASRAP